MRVVSLAVYLPVPYAAQRLTTLGADVTVVEPPGGDPFAHWSPAYYAELHAGQRVLRLDLKSVEGRAALDTWLADADLLLTSFRLSALARLGLSWDQLHARHPRLSHVALVGWRDVRDERPTHDLMLQAAAGLVSPPAMPTTAIADLAAGEQIVSTALAILLRGEPTFATVSLEQGVATFAAPFRHGLTTPGAMLGGGLAEYNVYRARDGWIAVAALEPHFASALTNALGSDLTTAFANASAAHWEEWAAEKGLPIVAVR